MKDLVRKVAVGLATGALISQSMALPAFGAIQVVVDGNGSHSDNTVGVTQETSNQVYQDNSANISNDINAKSNTGGNDANRNTGGDVDVNTGNAEAVVSVANNVNSNEASIDCGGCPSNVGVEVSGNGAKSDNAVTLSMSNTNWIDQDNHAKVNNDVDVKANSGYNDADRNTGGNVSVSTGTASALATVSNMANANLAHIGNGSSAGALDLIITGNGYRSDNVVDVALTNEDTIWQNNFANIANDVEVDANTGKNDADRNTGGSVSVSTGDAGAGAAIDNMANFNFADVSDCCEFDGLVKVAGNGEKSDSTVDLTLASALFVDQDNRLSCESHRFPFFGGKSTNRLFPFFPGFGGHDKDCNQVDATADTGRNDVDRNTGTPDGDPSIDTGNASTVVEVGTSGNSNVFTTGDALPELPDLPGDTEHEGSLSLIVMLLQMILG